MPYIIFAFGIFAVLFTGLTKEYSEVASFAADFLPTLSAIPVEGLSELLEQAVGSELWLLYMAGTFAIIALSGYVLSSTIHFASVTAKVARGTRQAQ